VKPLWALAAAALVAVLVARRRRLEPPLLVGGALAAAGMAVYATGLVELPRVDDLLEDLGRTLGEWTYLLVAAVAFFEAAAFLGLLVPGETGILVGGLVAGQGRIDIVILIAIAWGCAFAGDLVGYALGRRLGRPFLLRHGARFGLGRERVEAVEEFFERHGGKAIFVGRFVGLVRSLSPFLAGSSRMPLSRFVPYDILGSGLQSTLLCLVGFVFWRSIDTVFRVVKQGALALSVTIAALVAILLAARWLRVAGNRARVRAWLGARGLLGPARFVAERLTPGALGLELTTLLAVASVATYVLVGYALVFDTGAPTWGDRRALGWAGDLGGPLLDGLTGALLALGQPGVVAGAVLAAAGWLLRRGVRLDALVLLGGLGLTAAALVLIGDAVDRAALPVPEEAPSYPAPEPAFAAAWVAIAVAARHGLRSARAKALALATGIAAAAAVALSVVYRVEDWFSDAAGGLALGVLAFALVGSGALVAGALRRP
jgi:membrane protein DedA with SNARE-associated domain